MNIYWSILVGVGLFAALVANDKYFRNQAYILFLLTIIIVSSLRFKTGYDYDNYVDLFNRPVSFENGGSELAWLVVNSILHTITNNSQIIFIASSLAIYGSLGIILSQQTRYPSIPLLVFVLNIPFYWESLSILRQYIAMVIIVFASFQWVNGNKRNFLILLCFAVLFHATAVAGLAIPILSRWNSRLTFLLTFSLIAIIFSRLLENVIFAFSALEKYQAYFDGRIIGEGKESSGFVVYLRMGFGICLTYLLEKFTALPAAKKNLVSNSILLGQILFITLYDSLALRRVAHFFIIFELLAIGYLVDAARSRAKVRLAIMSTILAYLAFTTTLLAKDVWLNPIGRKNDSQINYEYRSILNN